MGAADDAVLSLVWAQRRFEVHRWSADNSSRTVRGPGRGQLAHGAGSIILRQVHHPAIPGQISGERH
jgi:hypothetical protein